MPNMRLPRDPTALHGMAMWACVLLLLPQGKLRSRRYVLMPIGWQESCINEASEKALSFAVFHLGISLRAGTPPRCAPCMKDDVDRITDQLRVLLYIDCKYIPFVF